MTNSLNIISETKRAVRPDINLLNQSLTPDMLDAAMGMKKKKDKKEKDIKKKASGNRKVNPWIAHLQEYRKNHPELSYRECMKAAKPSWIEKRNGKLMSGEPTKKEEKSPEKEKSKTPSASASPEKTEKEDSENEDKKDDDEKSDNDE